MTRCSFQMTEFRDLACKMTTGKSERIFNTEEIRFRCIPNTVEVLFVAVLTSDVLLFLLLFGFLKTSSLPLSSFLFVSAEKQRFFSLNFPLSLRFFRESLRLMNEIGKTLQSKEIKNLQVTHQLHKWQWRLWLIFLNAFRTIFVQPLPFCNAIPIQ